ncbi:hypothetical protein GOP47_0030392 [Adiantum capillus-veneris]|nr:hypothetical protein GOP47_0030392 [Adiantum capillus-veneris]
MRSFKRLRDQKNIDEALQVISSMQQRGQAVSSDMFYWVLQNCIAQKDLVAGRRLYCLILRDCLESNTFLGSHVIRMFASCGSLPEADEVFSRLPKHNLFAWSAAIAAHSRYGKAVKAFKLYMQMQKLCINPDEFIFASVLKICTKLGKLDQGQLVNLSIVEGSFEQDPGVCNALIDMYMKCGSHKDAHRVFDRMGQPDAVTMTALISGYSQHGCTAEVFEIFQEMLAKGLEPDDFVLSSLLKACSGGLLFVQGMLVHCLVVEMGFDEDAIVGSALVDMYVKCGDILDACKVFSTMPGTKLALWNSLTAGFALQGGQGLVSSYVEDLQRQGLKPDKLGFACLLSACSKLGLVGDGCTLFQWMQKRHGVTPTIEHFTCIADLLSRAGLVTRAEDLLQSMPAPSDAVGWSTVLSHFRTFGDARDTSHSSSGLHSNLMQHTCFSDSTKS